MIRNLLAIDIQTFNICPHTLCYKKVLNMKRLEFIDVTSFICMVKYL